MHRLVVWPGTVSRLVVTAVLAVNALEYHDPSPGQAEVWGTTHGWNVWVVAFGLASLVTAAATTNYAFRCETIVWQRVATVVASSCLVLRGIAIWFAFPDSLAAFMAYAGFGIMVAASWSWARTEQVLVDTHATVR